MFDNSFLDQLLQEHRQVLIAIPPKAQAQHFIDDLVEFLFPSASIGTKCLANYQVEYKQFNDRLGTLLKPMEEGLPQPSSILVDRFFSELPQVYAKLQQDASGILQFDPAATSLCEVVVTYPGFYAIAVFRLANILARLNVPLLPRLFTEHAHSKTGIDIHPNATIGCPFFIDHGTGVVIGATCIIGNHVKIYQGVTLGAIQVDKELAQTKRHPNIEDYVTIYSNATILGGRTTIGHHSVIGGNAWITRSIDPFSLVYHQIQVRVRQQELSDDILNFSI